MDMSDKLEVDKRREDSANYQHTPPMPPDWSNFSNSSSSIRMTSEGKPVGPLNPSMGSNVNSFVPPIWAHPFSTHSLGYSDVNLQNASTFSDNLAQTGGFPSSLRSGLNTSGWDALNSMLKEVNPFGIHQSTVNPCSHGGINIPPGLQLVFPGHVTEVGCGVQPSKHGITNQAFGERNVPLGVEKGNTLESERKTDGFEDEPKPSDSGETEIAGGREEELSMMDTATEPSSTRGPGSKTRKRGGQDLETDSRLERHFEAGNDTGGKLSSSPPSTKNNSGKSGKQISQSSDKPKGEYIHVRARRGQATNSHSLAERVRREKISERMKFLQDLVPGCSKVTGKAVMLDEIINYVQSLQRQVEFLSIKLATVNPRLDFNIESFLAKDPMFCAQAGPLQLGFSPDTMHIPYPSMHPPQQSLVLPGLLPIGPSPSDALRSMSPQLMGSSAGYKEPASQLPNVWDDDDLQNVVHMGLNPTASNIGSDGDGDGDDTDEIPESGMWNY